jgi:IS5 family transposase
MPQPGFFDIENRLSALSKGSDPLEALNKHIDFEAFRPLLTEILAFRGDKIKGGRPPHDPVLMFKILILQSLYSLSDDQAEFQVRDRLSFMRFLGLGLWEKVPDAKTIWLYRERLKAHMDDLFRRFNEQLKEKGYLAMGGQIVDASVIKAPRQRLSEDEKEAVKAGKSATEIWENPSKARQKDVDARWRLKQSRPKKGQLPLAIPEFGYKTHISADRTHGFIRAFQVTDAARFDGGELKFLLSKDVTCSKVWGDAAYFSQENQKFLEENGFISDLHRKKPKGKPLPSHISRANGRRSKIRAHIEHVFAFQKHRMGLFVRTIGLARAKVKIGFANLAYNMRRLVFFEERAVAG